MANIKVSEMVEATEFDDNDYTMIIQGNQNKKISKENMFDKDVYSLQEVKTNKIWIDGRPIYRKVFNFGELPDTGTKELAININDFDGLVEPIRGLTYKNDTKDSFPLPFVSTAGDTYFIDLSLTIDFKIRLRTKTNRSDMNAYIILEYTKTTD